MMHKLPMFSVVGNSVSTIQNDVDDGYYDSVTGSGFVNGNDEIAQGVSSSVALGGFYLFDSIPVLTGKTITDARLELQFTDGGDSGSGTTKLKVMAEDVLAPVFPINAADARGAVRTTAKIDWDDIPHVNEGIITSPNLKTIIQELIDTWTTPTSIILFVDDDGTVGTSVNLQVYSREDATGISARLILNF